MKYLPDIFVPFFIVLFFIFGILGIFAGIMLFFAPEKMRILEKLLAKKIIFKEADSDLDQELDRPRNIEYIFFNHHIMTGLVITLCSSLLIVLINHMPTFDINPINEYHSIYWILFIKYIIYPSLIIFLKLISIFSILFGISILTFPQHAFRFLRVLNAYFYTNTLNKKINKEFSLNAVYYHYSRLSGAFIFIISILLIYLLVFFL